MSVDGLIRGFDFHCHADLHPDPASLIEQCERKRIVTIAVTTTPKAWPQNREWVGASRYVHAAPGLHPELIGQRYAEKALLERCIADSPFIGEVGLDGGREHRANFDKQREVFRSVLNTAQDHGGRVLSIHSRRASRDVISMIEEFSTPERVQCILHWFTGTPAEVLRAAAAGCYFSINQAMLGSKSGAALVRTLPDDRLLTETDSPFTMVDNRKALPWDVVETGRELANMRGVSRSDMTRVLDKNARRVFDFAGVSLPEPSESDARNSVPQN